jgi:hypothetical protein
MSSRGKAFSHQEDRVLCSTWLEVSQDPILGTNQKKETMWERIIVLYYQNVKEFGGEQRSQRSLESRWDLIKKVINKFRGCIRQIERLNPSGASELDIVSF